MKNNLEYIKSISERMLGFGLRERKGTLCPVTSMHSVSGGIWRSGKFLIQSQRALVELLWSAEARQRPWPSETHLAKIILRVRVVFIPTLTQSELIPAVCSSKHAATFFYRLSFFRKEQSLPVSFFCRRLLGRLLKQGANRRQ